MLNHLESLIDRNVPPDVSAAIGPGDVQVQRLDAGDTEVQHGFSRRGVAAAADELSDLFESIRRLNDDFGGDRVARRPHPTNGAAATSLFLASH